MAFFYSVVDQNLCSPSHMSWTEANHLKLFLVLAQPMYVASQVRERSLFMGGGAGANKGGA